jgi:hypothetical protein
MSKDKASGVVVRVSGTSPLSFDVTPGTVLTIKEIAPSAVNRPTLGSKFKSKGYLLFKGITKLGRLSPSALAKIGESVPANCKVVQVDKAKKILAVEFE